MILSEKDFQAALIDRFKECDYLVNRVFTTRNARGIWLTTTTLKGLPDVMAVGRGHTCWVEVKREGGSVRVDQLLVLDAFAEIETNRCWLVRPTDDLQALANWIERPADAPRRFGWDAGMLESALKNTSQRTSKSIS